VVEAICGQFYIAALVADLIGKKFASRGEDGKGLRRVS
jgi:hypothetical protein